MELRHLRYAVAVAEFGHFGRAAAALGMAQPPLSRQIAAVEREVGVALFERTPRGARVTAAGAVFVGHARRILGEVDAGASEARRAARGEVGHLRMMFIGSALLELLPSLLARFRARHPAVVLELEEASTRRSGAALVGGEIDVAITRGAPRGDGAEGLSAIPVSHDELVVVCGPGHPYSGQRRVGIDQLRTQPLVAAPDSEEPATAHAVRALLDDPGRLPGTITRSRDVHTTVGLAACGVGVGLLPSCARSAARPDTWIAEVDPPVRLPDLVLAFRADDRSPVLEAFLATVAVHCPGTGQHLRHLGRTYPDTSGVSSR